MGCCWHRVGRTLPLDPTYPTPLQAHITATCSLILASATLKQIKIGASLSCMLSPTPIYPCLPHIPAITHYDNLQFDMASATPKPKKHRCKTKPCVSSSPSLPWNDSQTRKVVIFKNNLHTMCCTALLFC